MFKKNKTPQEDARDSEQQELSTSNLDNACGSEQKEDAWNLAPQEDNAWSLTREEDNASLAQQQEVHLGFERLSLSTTNLEDNAWSLQKREEVSCVEESCIFTEIDDNVPEIELEARTTIRYFYETSV